MTGKVGREKKNEPQAQDIGANSIGGNRRPNRDPRSVAEQNAHPTFQPAETTGLPFRPRGGRQVRNGAHKLPLRDLSPRPYANEVTFRSRLIGQALELVVEEPVGYEVAERFHPIGGCSMQGHALGV